VDIKAITGELTGIQTGAIIIGQYEGEKTPQEETAAVDKILGGAISGMIEQGDIKGKAGEITVIHTLGKLPASRVLVLGLGKKKELTANKLKGSFAEACRYLKGKNVNAIAAGALGTGVNGLNTAEAVQAMAEGAILGLYTFRQYITKKENGNGEIKTLTFAGDDKELMDKAIKQAEILASAVNYARDMVNEPSNHMTPADMAEAAKKLAADYNLRAEVFDKDWMKAQGMGGLMGVSQGSQQPPKFIILSYSGSTSKNIDVALVGKGITFDSGGISIKPSENMGDMKGDMAGGASVLAAVMAIAQLKPKINVAALVPATENMPSGTAMKPGDIIKIMNGKTVEVVNTDAEGRLILADALSYAVKMGAKEIIDVATLTGACQIALGNICTGSFSNNEKLQEKVTASGKESGEPSWPMPMFDDYKEIIKSDVADMKNSGIRWGSAISAAKFLEEFVDKTPWVHLDIAGTSDTDKDKGWQVKGATGVPVRTLVEFVLNEVKK
jgi:leucyl aminopeptidase